MELEEAPVTIVMGLDQHRAQITADWIDTSTEPAETAARRGNKKRAKNDRADARHLRELLMVSRLPESWIPPDHILDLRARVRLRHTLSAQRGEWQQRIQAVLYHHGCPQRRNLMTTEGSAGLPPSRCRRARVSRSRSRCR